MLALSCGHLRHHHQVLYIVPCGQVPLFGSFYQRVGTHQPIRLLCLHSIPWLWVPERRLLRAGGRQLPVFPWPLVRC